jgi:4-hydroxy-3-methylbut-2-enyl diphosphate reductase
LRRFQGKLSRGFDPDKHLCKVGLANQTTMYKRETRAIGRLLEKAMLRRYGPEQLPERYREFDTICDATQVSWCIRACSCLSAKLGYAASRRRSARTL